VGAIIFAAVLLIVGGIFQMIQGFVAITDDGYFAIDQDYVFTLDQTAWGWIHLVIGLLVTTAGLSLMRGASWARGVAVAVAGLSMFTNFLWLPHSPLWSLTTIAMSVAVIWAVTSHGRDAEIMRSGAPSTPSEPRTYV
jgi:hypothetical protein